MIISAGIESEFSGIYILHWEITGVVIEVGRKLWGLLPKRERWYPRFPSGFEPPGEAKQTESLRSRPGRFFRIRFVGVPSEHGNFGHRGFCCRQVEIRRVLEIAEVTKPEKIW